MSGNKILFINGINVNNGGAGYHSLNYWIGDFIENNKLKLINLVPSFSRNKYLNNLILFIYYFPFSFLKLFKIPLLEYFYKISIFSIVKVLIYKSNKDVYILSHHSIFYLKYLIPKNKRILLVHDLISEKSKNQSSNYISNKLSEIIEFFFIKNEKCFVQSSKENNILKQREINSILIKCYPLNVQKIKNQKIEAGLLADWRRAENINDLKLFKEKFFNNELTKIPLKLYGFRSRYVYENLNLNEKNIELVGVFNDYNDLKFKFLLVPNYSGAGIKLKILEAVMRNKIIIGTKLSVEGLEGLEIEKCGLFIEINKFSYKQINYYLANANFNMFKKNYEKLYKNISESI